MKASRSSLGSCPNCGTAIPRRSILIEYETSEGTDCYAECPGCEEVVHPMGHD